MNPSLFIQYSHSLKRRTGGGLSACFLAFEQLCTRAMFPLADDDVRSDVRRTVLNWGNDVVGLTHWAEFNGLTSTVSGRGVRTLRHQDTSAPVPKCLGAGVRDISAPI